MGGYLFRLPCTARSMEHGICKVAPGHPPHWLRCISASTSNGRLAKASFQDPWNDPKSRCPLGFCSLHHRSFEFRIWASISWILPGVWVSQKLQPWVFPSLNERRHWPNPRKNSYCSGKALQQRWSSTVYPYQNLSFFVGYL